MSDNIKTELKALGQLIAFGIKLFTVLFICQQAIWAAWVVFG